jgi:predicted membrane channel-forming protein YqfA (hemolysin III family)
VIESLLMLIVWLLILGAIAYVVYWGIGRVPIPEPFRTVIYVVLAIVFLILIFKLVLLPLVHSAGLS